MIWQQEVLDKIVSKIKPFSDSAKKYKANEEEKLFIENLAREMLNKNAYALMLPLYGGADSAIPFPPVCGSADNPPPVLFAKISASVLFRSYSTSPFGNRIWRKKTAHTIKNLPFFRGALPHTPLGK